jgi:hypothetical protein
MTNLISININKETALDMLMDRLNYWIKDHTEKEQHIEKNLFCDMYENYLDGGCFDGAEFDPMNIVDNDWVNWCAVIDPTNDDYEKIDAIYQKQGLGDCSCLDCGCSYIESVFSCDGSTYYLIRY